MLRPRSSWEESPLTGCDGRGNHVFLDAAVWSGVSAGLSEGREAVVLVQIAHSCLSYQIFIDFLG